MDKLKEVNKLLKEMEHYTGKKLPVVTELQQNAEMPSSTEWKEVMREVIGSKGFSTVTDPFSWETQVIMQMH